MKYIIKTVLAVLLVAGALQSCIKDKGNYDYNWVREMELRIPELEPSDSLTLTSGDNLTLVPEFYDKQTDEKVDINYDDYQFQWWGLPYGSTKTEDRILLSELYNLDAPINMAVRLEYHTVTLTAINKKTTQFYRKQFALRMTGLYDRAYFFLIEDETRNMEMDIYGWSPEGEVNFTRSFLRTKDFTQTGGGANAITFDKFNNRIYFASGQSMAWLGSPTFDYDPVNSIDNILVPTTETTFSAIKRLGGTGASATSRNLIFFGTDGAVYNFGNSSRGMSIDYSNVGGRKTVIAPMVAGYVGQMSSVYWSVTDRKLGWASLRTTGMDKQSYSITLLDEGIGKELSECLYMGGSQDREMITVIKDVDGDYWRVDLASEKTSTGMMGNVYMAKVQSGSPRKLAGTEALGDIDFWINSHQKGYLYAIADNRMHTYVEAQAGGIADPGWTEAVITDTEGRTVTFSDPVTLVHFENDGLNCMYVFTYSQANGGTLFMLRPREVGADLELVDKITGLGNVKQMCYWWG